MGEAPSSLAPASNLEGRTPSLPRIGAISLSERRAVRFSSMPTKVRELLAQLHADGWYEVRQSGSHKQFRHPSKLGTVTVAGKPSVEVPAGTLSSILKQAGLKN